MQPESSMDPVQISIQKLKEAREMRKYSLNKVCISILNFHCEKKYTSKGFEFSS